MKFHILLLGLILSTTAFAETKIMKLYYDPAIFSKPFTPEQILELSNSLSSNKLQIAVTRLEISQNTALNSTKATADFGLTNTEDYFVLKKSDPKIQIIATFSEQNLSGVEGSCSQDAQLIVAPDSKIKSIEDMKNHIIGVISPEKPSAFTSKVFLIDHKIDSNVYVFNSMDELRNQLLTDKVDAILGNDLSVATPKNQEGVSKSSISKIFSDQAIKYKIIGQTNYHFPCHVIYAAKGSTKEDIKKFIINLNSASSTNKLKSLRLTNVSTSLNKKMLKRLEDLANQTLKLKTKEESDAILLKLSCEKDVTKYCVNKPVPEAKNDYECLNINFEKLEKKCNAFLTGALKYQLCHDDLIKFCKGNERENNQMFSCLQSHINETNPKCQSWIAASLSKAKAATAEVEKVCAKSVAPCDGITGKAKGACMDKLYYDNKLSPECKVLFYEMRIKRLNSH